MSQKSNQKELKQYLSKINPVIERLVVDLLIDMPQDYIEFSINWMNNKGRSLASGKQVSERPSSYKPNITVKETPNFQFEETQFNKQNSIPTNKPPVKSAYLSDSEDQGEEDEHVDELEIQQQVAKKKNTRSSVSAEAYGNFNKKGDSFVPRVISKTEDQKARIQKRLEQSFLFQNLDEKQKEIVLGALEEKKYMQKIEISNQIFSYSSPFENISIGEQVIRQGEDGEVLYIVDQGELDCFRVFKKGDEPKFLKVYLPGDAFGELALLYNAPRAATIIAKTDSVLFALDRSTFNNIVKDASQKKRERYEVVLAKVQLLSEMDPYERLHVCDGIKQKQFKAGEIVIKQGDEGDIFYMVDEGDLAAYKLDQNGVEKEVLQYQSGDYFGQLALLKNQPRSATVKSQSNSTLVYLESKAFHKLLGPIEEILQRNASQYSQFLN